MGDTSRIKKITVENKKIRCHVKIRKKRSGSSKFEVEKYSLWGSSPCWFISYSCLSNILG